MIESLEVSNINVSDNPDSPNEIYNGDPPEPGNSSKCTEPTDTNQMMLKINLKQSNLKY